MFPAGYVIIPADFLSAKPFLLLLLPRWGSGRPVGKSMLQFRYHLLSDPCQLSPATPAIFIIQIMLVELSGFFFFPLFLFFLLSLINVTQVSSYCSVSPKESLPSVPAAQLGLISAKSELELSFLCLSSPLVLCAAPPHSLCVNQVKDNEVLCLVGQFSSISASFLSALFTHKPAFLIYLLLLAWKHILCGIWPSPWLPKSPSLQCPCHKTVFWCCLCRQTVPRDGVLWHWAAPCCSLHLTSVLEVQHLSRKGCCSLLLRHWWPIFIFPSAVQRQKKVRPSKGVLMINWSLLPVPECRLELERAGSPSSIHRKQLETFLISSSTHTCHWMCEWSLKFCLVSCIKAALALDAVIWFHSHPLPGCLCQAERLLEKDAFLCATFMFQLRGTGGAWFPFFWLHPPWWAAPLAH